MAARILIFLRQLTIASLIPAICCGLCAIGFAAEQKRETTQYERRLQMLANRYSNAPAGTMEFPKELMAVDYINEGYKLFAKNQYDLAREAALNALIYDPKSPVAHELAGDVDYLSQNLASADNHYRLAFQYEPSARLRDKLQKLTRETVTEKNLHSVDEMHFLIKYDRNQSEYDGFELRMLLHETYLAVAHDLAHYLNHKTTVLFYTGDQFRQTANLPHWVGGLFDGKVRLPVNPRQFGEQQLRAVARHEVTHVFLHDISRGRAPIWLHEGLATYEQNKVQPMPPAALGMLSDPRQQIPFADFFDPRVLEKHKDDQLWLNRFYLQGYLLVNYLVNRYGMFSVKKIGLEFAEEKNVEEIIQDIFKTSIVKLEREWKASL